MSKARFGTDRLGYRDMLADGRQFADRVWAIEGCNGVGKHIAHRLVHDGELATAAAICSIVTRGINLSHPIRNYITVCIGTEEGGTARWRLRWIVSRDLAPTPDATGAVAAAPWRCWRSPC